MTWADWDEQLLVIRRWRIAGVGCADWQRVRHQASSARMAFYIDKGNLKSGLG